MWNLYVKAKHDVGQQFSSTSGRGEIVIVIVVTSSVIIISIMMMKLENNSVALLGGEDIMFGHYDVEEPLGKT